MIASGLKAAGFKVGLYNLAASSLVYGTDSNRWREHIQAGFHRLDRRIVAPSSIKWQQQSISRGDLGVVSVFEMLTAMAFVHFRRVENRFCCH